MRSTDSERVRCFRTDRFFVVSAQWYFSTRESEDFGPFDSREEAATRLGQYLDTQAVMQQLRIGDPVIVDSCMTSVKRIARLSRDIHRTALNSTE